MCVSCWLQSMVPLLHGHLRLGQFSLTHSHRRVSPGQTQVSKVGSTLLRSRVNHRLAGVKPDWNQNGRARIHATHLYPGLNVFEMSLRCVFMYCLFTSSNVCQLHAHVVCVGGSGCGLRRLCKHGCGWRKGHLICMNMQQLQPFTEKGNSHSLL